MSYDITKPIAPKMPALGKGTECIRILLSQTSKDMHEPLVSMAMPALSAHLTDVEFMYCDNKHYELCGQMGHLIGPSGIGKAQLTHLIEAIMRSFRDHDETEYKKLVDWQRQMKTRGANKEKPERPDVCFWFPPADLTNGFFGRIPFAYKARGERSGRIPRQGNYDEAFLKKLDEYLLRLDNCKGKFVVKPLNKVADQLAEEMAKLADLADDDTLFELSHRSIFSAWKKAATLWILNDQTWTRSIGEFMVWFCYYDLWSKVQVFGDMFKGVDIQSEDGQKRGPKNMLDSLDKEFHEYQLEALRESLGKSKEGTKGQLRIWKFRGFITYSNQTGLYTKTEEYLKGKV